MSAASRELTGAGTPESDWAAAGLPGRLPVLELDLLAAERVVLVAPHPDDEVLGAGGTLALLAGRGAEVHVVAVTDGEASHPGRAEQLRRVRELERTAALARLGLGGAHVHQLRQPDGGVDAAAVTALLAPLLTAGDLLLAPWAADGHPDHDACGEAAQRCAGDVGCRRWSYLVWAWHWATPPEVPWERAQRVPLPTETAAAKVAAVRAFDSQLAGPDEILPPHVLARLLRSDEVLLP